MKKDRTPAFIITVGASAGGLNAVSELVSQFPEDLNAAVFIVIHLSKTGVGNFIQSRMQKYTAFTCIIPKNGDRIEAGHIYIAPQDMHLTLEKGFITLRQESIENRWKPSIDVLFMSAAATYRNCVIGIILTGYSNDGAAGMRAVKKNNGFSIIQDPKQAEYPDLPLSISETVEVDYCLPLDKMGQTIFSIVNEGQPIENGQKIEVTGHTESAEQNRIEIGVLSRSTSDHNYAQDDPVIRQRHVYRATSQTSDYHNRPLKGTDHLLIKEFESIEETVWMALRIMEDRKNLLQKVGEEEARKGYVRLANIHRQRASDLQVHIDQLEKTLIKTKNIK